MAFTVFVLSGKKMEVMVGKDGDGAGAPREKSEFDGLHSMGGSRAL